MAFSRIVAATDLRIESDEAIRHAIEIAQGRHRVAVCHVIPDTRVVRTLFPQMNSEDALASLEAQRWAREAMDRCMARLGNPDVDVYFESGVPYLRIVERARALDADLVVLAGPRPGDAPAGTADGVARYAPMPVLIARPSPRGPVLATTDLSDPSVYALRIAARQAEALGLELVALHVLDVERETSWLDVVRGNATVGTEAYAARVEGMLSEASAELRTLLAREAPNARAEVARGRASETISRRAKELGASLLVIGTHGRTGFDRVVVGSVAETVVRTAPCAVLTVRHEKPLPPA